MDLCNVIKELYEELGRIDHVIKTLELYAAAQKKPRGRPPKWLVEARQEDSGKATGKKTPKT